MASFQIQASWFRTISPGVPLGIQSKQPPLHNLGEFWQDPTPCPSAIPGFKHLASQPLGVHANRQLSSEGPVGSKVGGGELTPWDGLGGLALMSDLWTWS